MNKNEKFTLYSMLAEWEFRTGGSSSETVGRAGCIEEIRQAFNITDEDLSYHRAFQICQLVGDDSQEFYDVVCDLITDDYRGLIDAIEDAKGFEVVKDLVAARNAGPKL